MAKALFNLKSFTPIKTVRDGFDSFLDKELNTYYKRRLEEITAPFDTDFTFEVVQLPDSDDNLTYNVRPVEVEIERTSSNNGSVSSWILFNTLDLGSEGAAKVYLPDDFDNESSPDSLQTVNKKYDRSKIFVDASQKTESMEARNWSALLVEELNDSSLKRARVLALQLGKRALGITDG